MERQTLTFLRDLFAGCTSGYLTLTAIHPDGVHPTPSRHVPLGNAAALDRAMNALIRANERGWGAYFGVAPRNGPLGRWSRGGRADLVALPALFVDIDQNETEPYQLAWFDLPPSCVIASGHGYHAYWFLETPTREFATADRALRGLAEYLNGDPALTIAQSMRLPGTVNTKPGRNNALCTIERYAPERRYQLAEFSPFLPQPAFRVYASDRPRLIGPWPHDADRQVLIDAVTTAVMTRLNGRPGTNGFIRALCPYCHQRDGVGMHFSYHPESGVGHCFGKHGRIGLRELATALGVDSVAIQETA